MKKGLAILFFSITLLSFVSAYYGSYYGGGFSLSDLLNEIDSETMLLGVTFIVSFALINLSLSRFFSGKKDVPPAVPAIISFCLALGITWGINKKGFDIEDIFYSIGFSEDFLSTFLPLVIFGLFIFAVIKWKGSGFIYTGFILMAFGATSFFYEWQAAIFAGAVMIGIGIAINKIFPKKTKEKSWAERLSIR